MSEQDEQDFRDEMRHDTREDRYQDKIRKLDIADGIYPSDEE